MVEPVESPTRVTFSSHLPSRHDEEQVSLVEAESINNEKPTPLPFKTMCILCFVILAEPISMTILFPFIYFMVRDFGIANEKDTGYYVGFIASSFSFAQFLTSVFWGWTSDRIGRRPVLLIGLIGNSVTNISFGLSKSLAWALTSRAACGFLNGNIGVAKCIMGEITDNTNKALAFSYMSLVWGIGLIVGPVLGGYLSHPADKFPLLFGSSAFLKTNPYFLPCAFSASFSLIGFMVGYVYLEETSKNALKRRNGTQEEQAPLLADQDSSDTLPTSQEEGCCPPIKTPSAITRATVMCIISYAIFAFFDIIMNEVFSIWMVAPLPDGMGYSSSDVGLCLSMMGGVTLVVQIMVYPRLDRRMASLTLYRSAFPFLILSSGLFPIITWAANNPHYQSYAWNMVLGVQGIRHVSNVVAFTGINLLINNSATPSRAGLIMGLAQTSVAFMRAVGPATGGILWSWSLSNHLSFPLDHHFTFIFLTLLAIIAYLHSYFIPSTVNEKAKDVE